MGVPYESTTSCTYTGASPQVFTIPYPSRVFITKIVADRTAGSGEFTLELFNRDPAQVAQDPHTSLEPYRVAPSMTSVSGVISNFPAQPYVFVNRDGDTDVNRRAIYAKITSASGTSFDITLTAYSTLGPS